MSFQIGGGITFGGGISITIEGGAPSSPTTTWVTAAGSLGNLAPSTAITPIQLQATTTSGTVVFTITSGSLPSGLSMNSSGLITGTTGTTTATSTFTVSAVSNAGGSPVTRTFSLTVETMVSTFIKASYQDITVGWSSGITAQGFQNSNMIIFAFADFNTNQYNPTYLSDMEYATSANPTATYLLSVGGALNDPTTINATNANAIVANVHNQITQYNAQFAASGNANTANATISGVDLDLEGGITSSVISTLVNGFKGHGYKVSIAPQIYLTTGTDITMTNPTNLALSSAGSDNAFAPAIQSGNVDYIFTQTYNSGGFTIGNVAESSVNFFINSAKALNYAVNNPSAGVNIPSTTKIIIGEPSNAGAAFNQNSIFDATYGNSGPNPYNQGSTLTSLNSLVTTLRGDSTNYGHISGVGQWSLNNDYNPSGYGDAYANVGGFSTTVFGPSAPASQ